MGDIRDFKVIIIPVTSGWVLRLLHHGQQDSSGGNSLITGVKYACAAVVRRWRDRPVTKGPKIIG